MTDLVAQLLAGDRRALARLLTQVENEQPGVMDTLAALFPHTGQAHIIGITGAPGTGKSTLVNALARNWRARGNTVGIVAVDPTSPFSGGAILGDRIRMGDLSGDPGIFIRSMATRGHLGGLARTTRDAIRLLDAAGFDMIMVETVGTGQSEIDIARLAQTTVVVNAPGLGDGVQAIKAGILEIADVLVVNKADRPGAINTVRAFKTMLDLGHPPSRAQLTAHQGQLLPPPEQHTQGELWLPPIVQTVATEEAGIDELAAAIDDHQGWLSHNSLFAVLERQQIEIELHDRLQAALMARLRRQVPDAVFDEAINRIQARELDPYQAVQTILDRELTDDI